jgi:hypothetical protein
MRFGTGPKHFVVDAQCRKTGHTLSIIDQPLNIGIEYYVNYHSKYMGVSGGPTLCWACPTDVNMTAHGPETISNERPKSDSWDLEIMCLRVKLDEKNR